MTMARDNRAYVYLRLGCELHKELLDVGATVSMVGPRVMAAFKNRIDSIGNAASAMKSGIGGTTMIDGDSKMALEIGGRSD